MPTSIVRLSHHVLRDRRGVDCSSSLQSSTTAWALWKMVVSALGTFGHRLLDGMLRHVLH